MSTFSRQLRAAVGALAAPLALWLALFTPAVAHDGHDHGKTVAAPVAAGTPKLTLQSELYQFVAALKDGDLIVFLDRTADNTPVTDAAIALTVGDASLNATPLSDGTYIAEGGPLRTPGRHEVIAAITGGAGDDLLIGTLDIAGSSGALQKPAEHASVFEAIPSWIYGAALFLGGAMLGFLLRGGRRVAAAILLAAAFVAPHHDAAAHEGHDHGAEKSAAPMTGDVPRRAEDGSLFVPKATQRLLDVRTVTVKSGSAPLTAKFIGRVIADPNRSGLVQSVNGGRIVPTPNGLPRLGQTVKKGEILAEIEPPIATGDYSDLAERAGEIDQQIALTEAKIARFERLVTTNAVAQAQLDDAKVELDGLQRRKAAIRNTQREREVLRAPVDGVIATASAAPGQVVEARDVLFQVIAPKSFWVEALAFDSRLAAGLSAAHVVLEGGGRSYKLTFQGQGRALQQHGTVLQFAVDEAADLSIGLPVTVLAERAEKATGKLVPREAVVRGANGQDLVFEHLEPERFMPRPVKIAPVDGDTVLIVAGVNEGARIAVRSAEMLNQVR
ncbi:MAG: efflux RND transporter periplasmic adaptor subunit [Hyphomicrobiales bacterium]|nr:efflux RND transporter periplasmic adaptor subunit [Hyphomicrobiales bacterium]